MRLEVLPVTGIGEVVPGDDLAALIGDAAPWLRDGDVLVVTSKIVSKAEGRLVDLPAEEPDRARVRDELLAAETAAVVARRGATRIVRTRHGFVMAAAGIDNSNVAPTRLVLLPVDPDRSARQLRAGLRARLGIDLAVVVSDTMGRPWRNGLTDVALGAAGIDPVRDYRGQTDRYGNELRLTQMAVVDEIAGAGDLVKGKSEQVPVAVVRGYPWRAEPPVASVGPDGPGVRPLIREPDQDMFPLGTAEARRAGLVAAATLPATTLPAVSASTGPPGGPVAVTDDLGPVDGDAVARAVRLVSEVVATGTRVELVDADDLSAHVPTAGADHPAGAAYPALLRCRPPGDAPAQLVRFGADLHRLRVALAAAGVASADLGTVAAPGGVMVLLGLVEMR